MKANHAFEEYTNKSEGNTFLPLHMMRFLLSSDFNLCFKSYVFRHMSVLLELKLSITLSLCHKKSLLIIEKPACCSN